MARRPTYVQFIWHFHQPYYDLPGRGRNVLPWVRLHAVKSYYDMARILDRFPDVSVTFNYSGALLEQICEYVEDGKRDVWWELTMRPVEELSDQERHFVLRHFFSIDHEQCVEPIPRYRELLERRGDDDEIEVGAFSDQELRDLQVLFNLAWCGFSARSERPVIGELLDKGRGFTQAEKEALLEQHIEIMQLLLPQIRELHERGQVEVSASPMYHPIVPLLVDTDVAAESMSDVELPSRLQARGDAERHIERALEYTRSVLGVEVEGMWPSEGAVSEEAVELFDAAGLDWIASDEEILERSRGADYDSEADRFGAWRLAEQPGVQCFFRDRYLSDQISFTYADREPAEAVDHFLERVRAVEAAPGDAPPVVTVILDGENPWEHYPGDGEPFLTELYGRLQEVEDIETTCPSRYLHRHGAGRALERLHPGSWIDASFRIWIGHGETNTAWELVRQTHRDLESFLEASDVDQETCDRCRRGLAMAEGSDWFWWYGEDFSTLERNEFDRLFRDQLRYVYRTLDLPPPAELYRSVLGASGEEAVFEPPTRLIRPRIDGRSDYFYEWSGAGFYRSRGDRGAMYDSRSCIDEIYLGFDLDYLYGRIEFEAGREPDLEEVTVRVHLGTPMAEFEATLRGEGGGGGELAMRGGRREPHTLELVAVDENVEFAIDFEELGIDAGEKLEISMSLSREGMELEHHPPDANFELVVPDSTFDLRNWMV